MNDDSWALQHFHGVARLFPLPNVVLFPQVIQPLHIFEPRYRQMTADALADDRLIAPVLLRPGWETDYDGRPAVCTTLCLGRIVAEQRLPDGRYNLLLRGLSRGRILEEVPGNKPYRSARVELQRESDPPDETVSRALHKQLEGSVRAWFPPQGPAVEQLEKLLHSKLPLGALCDFLSFAVPLAVEAKQQLLEELDILRRAQALVCLLKSKAPSKAETSPAQRRFPPDFSSN